MVVCLLFFLPGCRKSDAVPAYLAIPAVRLSASPAEGGSTSKITDVWVSVNDKDLGVWELPARVPVIGEGSHRVRIAPGVKVNGAFDDRVQYPYYTAWTGTVDLGREGSSTTDPVVTYQGAEIWSERFDDVGSLLNTSEGSDTTLLFYTPEANPSIVRDGTICGGFVLDGDRQHMQLYTDQDFYPTSGPAYLELDYSTDVALVIGYTYVMSGTTRLEPLLVLVPTTSEGGLSWNKVYVDVTTFFNVGGVSNRDFYIQADLPSGQSSAHVYLDNVKLVRAD